MPSVRFDWNPTLVDLRRDICPGARWQKQGRRWIMTDAEAERFVQAAHEKLDYQRWQARICVEDTTWIVGFVRDAPFALPNQTHALAGSNQIGSAGRFTR